MDSFSSEDAAYAGPLTRPVFRPVALPPPPAEPALLRLRHPLHALPESAIPLVELEERERG